MVVVPLFVCLYAACVSNWRDPSYVVTFDVSMNATLPLQIGQAVEFSCTSHNALETATLEWNQIIADKVESRVIGGRSTLTLVKTITQADHGTDLQCATWFYDTNEEGFSIGYYARSTKFHLEVEGVNNPSPNPFWLEKIWVNADPVASSYEVGQVAQFVCDGENLGFPFIEMWQTKSGLAVKVFAGYNLGSRWLSHELAPLDDGLQYCCSATLLDASWNTHTLYSDPYLLNVNH